jgi:2-phosphoglycerate kinase
MSRNIILIGGTPTVGKSTIAQAVAGHFNLPWISSDQIREIMRTVARREDYPDLFTPEGYDAERFLSEFTADEIAKMEYEEGDATWPGVKKLIEEDYTWRDGFVVEGVNILPHLIDRDLKGHDDVRAIFLVDEDKDRMKHVVFTRGLWGDAKSYSDDVKDKEVEWATAFSKILEAEVKKYGFPWVSIQKNAEDLSRVLAVLKQK